MKLICNGARAMIAVGSVTMLLVGCGSGGNGSGETANGSGGSAVVTGNVSSASTASLEEPRSWLAWIAEEGIGLARPAYAQIPDLSVGGIEVAVVASSGASGTDVTGPNGDFEVIGAPSGDLSVEFRRGSCLATVALENVPEEALVELEDVIFDCNEARPNRIGETFEGIVHETPDSSQGNVVVCTETAAAFRVRAVMIRSASFEDGAGEPSSLVELAVGDRVEVSGERVGLGAPAAVDAERVRILGSGNASACTEVEVEEDPGDPEDPQDPAPELPIDPDLPI